MIHKVKKIFLILRYLPHTIYFNFHYLPFSHAIKLPIYLYKPKFVKCKGKIILDSHNIKCGMIELGFNHNHAYPNSGIIWENNGGNVIFRGKTQIGNNSSICIGKNAQVSFGDNFSATTTFKLINWYKIHFGDNVCFGWDNLVLDTSFHRLTNINGEKHRSYGPIIISHDTWIATRCIILANTETQPYTVVATNSLLSKKYEKEYVMLAGSPAKIIQEGVWRNPDDDKITYE